MKRVATIAVLLVLSVCLTACNSKAKECEQLIEDIGTLDTYFYFDNWTGKYKIDRYGMNSFEKADEFYWNLSPKQREKVRNIDKLESQREAYQKLANAYSELMVKTNIWDRVHNEVSRKAKQMLKTPSSFEEISFDCMIVDDSIDWNTGEFRLLPRIEYSGTNGFGGRGDLATNFEVNGTYDFETNLINDISATPWRTTS